MSEQPTRGAQLRMALEALSPEERATEINSLAASICEMHDAQVKALLADLEERGAAVAVVAITTDLDGYHFEGADRAVAVAQWEGLSPGTIAELERIERGGRVVLVRFEDLDVECVMQLAPAVH